jgi:cytidylate kinase
MKEKGMEEPFEKVLEELKARDEQDMNRPVEPLRQAPDAVLVDSTSLTFDETVDAIVRIAEAKRHG